MLRYAISFPGILGRDVARQILAQLRDSAGSPSFRDVVLDQGGTIIDLRTKSDMTPARIRLARARMR